MASMNTQRASRCKYDVFLSFRGPDTRRSFTDHLYAALIRKGIYVFRDDKELEKGKSISELLKTIEESRISIVVFSKTYAYSKWCLDELVKIVECKNASNHRQLVYPIFYEAEPTVTSSFEKVFVKHEQDLREYTEKLQKWKDAFEEVSHISGWELNDRNESEFISEIVNEISSKIPTKYQILKDLVGIDSHLEKMRYLIDEKPRDVRMIGICGMGGIGKTTLARVAYDLFSHEFEESCFLAHVREISEKKGSVMKLQKQLISKLLKLGDNSICSVYDGIEMIASRLPCKKVLVVIDDVTDLKQLECLAGKHEWFGPGSRIIITSRDGHLLKTHGVDEVYKLMVLHEEEALQLFCTKAFKTHRPLEEYVELSGRVIKHAGGLPLALQVLGCYLSGSTREEWESAITKLEIAPHKDIQEVLIISYDGLDDFDKNIFVDIACFFGGENHINTVESFLGVRGFPAKIGLKLLIDRSLMTLSSYNSISMHDLLRDMGREIVRKESINDPGKRSRLWHHENIYKILKENTGTDSIEIICLDMSKVKETRLNPCTFSNMRKLKFLKFYGKNKFDVSSFQDVRFIELRYFEWQEWPLKMLNIHAENLVSLKLRGSNVHQLWDDVQNLGNLKKIDLRRSKQLMKLPDLSQAKNLEKLILNDCSSLIETHSSIENLNKLVVLELSGCKSLMSLPASIRSTSLKVLELSGCTNLKNLPKISSCKIDTLDLTECGIEEVPSSIGRTSNLRYLMFCDCTKLSYISNSIYELTSLKYLYLNNCSSLRRIPENIILLFKLKWLNLSCCGITKLPEHLGQLSSLEELVLKENKIERIPESIIHLSKLQNLDICYCERLQSLPELPCNLRSLFASDCTSLEAISGLPGSLTRIDLANCFKLDRNEFREIVEDYLQKFHLEDIKRLYGGGWNEYAVPYREIFFSGNEIPKWFMFQNMGSSLTFQMPAGCFNKLIVFAFCAILQFPPNTVATEDRFSLVCECKVKYDKFGESLVRTSKFFTVIRPDLESDHVKLGLSPFYFDKEDMGHFGNCDWVFEFFFQNDEVVEWCKVKKCGAHLFCAQEEKEQEEEPHPKRLKHSST